MQATILVICGRYFDHDAALDKKHTPALPVLLYYVKVVSAVYFHRTTFSF